MNNTQYVYLVLTRTGTVFSKVIGLATGKKYTHASIASNEMLTDMYSFCRDHKERPLPANFNHEEIFTEVFGACKTIPSEVYRIPVNDDQIERYHTLIRHFVLNREKYSYDLGALLPMALHIPYKMRNNKFVCSVWVGFMLGKTGIVNDMKKHPSLIEPEDFRSVKGAELIYKGDLKLYRDYIKNVKAKRMDGKVPTLQSETA